MYSKRIEIPWMGILYSHLFNVDLALYPGSPHTESLGMRLMCTFMHLESQSKKNNCPSGTHLVPRLVVSIEKVSNEDQLCKLSSLFTMVAMAVYIIYFIVNFSL